MNFREVVKARRRTLKISQQDLAEMSGLGVATIKGIERGKGNPSLSTVTRILEVLGMEIDFKLRQTVI